MDGIRFEIPSRFRHLQKTPVRYASWDLGHVYLTDPHTATVLARLYPLDRSRNADGLRRSLEPDHLPSAEAVPPPAVAPLLRKLLEQYSATGLPPAYLPQTQKEES